MSSKFSVLECGTAGDKDCIDCIGSSNGDFRTLTVDNGHLVEVTSVKLVVIYSVCFVKLPWTHMAFNNTCE